MNRSKHTAILSIILLQALVWMCSKAPLPTDGNQGNDEKKMTLGKIIVSSANHDGEPIDSARVFWDGQFIGYTPLTNENVQYGVHALRVQKQGFEIYFESIAIANEQPVYVEALLKKMPLNKGQLLVTIDQDSARTIITNSQSDVIDLFYTREKAYILDPGGYFLRTEKPGFRLVHIALEIKADTIVVKNIQLEKIDNPELPALEFCVTPDSIDYDQPVQVTWNSNGYQVIIDQGIGVRGPSGSEEILFINPGVKVFTAVAYGENRTITTKRDTVLIKAPMQPNLPIIILAVVDSVQVGMPITVEWHSQNAYRVDIDYVQNPGLNGKAEVVFQSEGGRTITATAYNQAGQVTVAETLYVVSNVLKQPQVTPLIMPANATVCAIHPGIPQVVDNIGPAEIKVAGYYRVIATVWYNSGDDQKNESFFIVINEKFHRKIYPEDANVGIYKVVLDDPGPPHIADRDAGLFYLSPGEITIGLHHYYTISDQYPKFIIEGPINGAESVEVISFKLEYSHP